MVKLPAVKNKTDFFTFLEKTIPILAGVFIFIKPLPYNTSAQQILFYLLLGCLLVLLISKYTDFSLASPLTIPFALFGLWIFICVPFALDKRNTLHDIYAHYLKHVFIFYIIINYFNSRKKFLILSWMIVISIAVFSIGGIIYFYFIQGNSLHDRFGLPIVDVDINHVGFLAVPAILISIVFLMTEKLFYKKCIALISLIFAVAVVVFSGTRGALLGLVLPLPLLFFHNKKFVILALAFVAIFVLVTPFKNQLTIEALRHKIQQDAAGGRLPIWLTHIQAIKERPVTGTGFGMESYTLDFFIKHNSKLPAKYHSAVYNPAGPLTWMPHNTLIDITVRTGIIGLSLFFFCLYKVLAMAWGVMREARSAFVKNYSRCFLACCLSLLIQGMFVDLMIGFQVVYLFIFFAMIHVLWRIQRDREPVDE